MVVAVVEVVVEAEEDLKGFLRKTGAISLVLFKGMVDRSAARLI